MFDSNSRWRGQQGREAIEGYARESSQFDKCYPAVIDTRELITHSTLMLIDTARPGSAALDRSGREMALRQARPGKQMDRVAAGGISPLPASQGHTRFPVGCQMWLRWPRGDVCVILLVSSDIHS